MRGAVDKIGEMPMNAATTWNKKYPNKYAICLYCNLLSKHQPQIRQPMFVCLFHKGLSAHASCSAFSEFKWNLESIPARHR